MKHAFERNYGCMGITCEDVGGLYNDADETYLDNAGPCAGSGGSSSETNVGLAVGLSIGAVVALALVFLLIKRRRSSASEVEFKSDNNPTSI